MAIYTTEVKIFYSYAEEDETLCKRLDKHLAPLRRQGLTSWYDHKMLPGTERTAEIDTQLNTAHIILLLISPDFLESSHCYNVEVERALQRSRAGETRVIPIILRPVNLQGTVFETLEALPKNKKPVSKWIDKDEACVNITDSIRSVIDDIAKQGPLDDDNPDKQAMREAFASQTQHFEEPLRSTTTPITSAKLDFRRKLVTDYDLDPTMAAFKEPLDYGEAFRFVIAGDERVLRQYVIERMLQEFKEQIQGECFTTPIDLNKQDLSSYPLPSLLEEKIKRRFNYTNARELVTKHALEHVILTVWNYDLPLLTLQEAVSAFWKSFVPAISRHLCRKNLCFVLILAHLPPENQPCLMKGVTFLQLPDFDVQRGLRPWLSRNLRTLNVPDHVRDYCLNQLQDLYPNPVQILRRMEYIASYLQGEYNKGRFDDMNVRSKRRS